MPKIRAPRLENWAGSDCGPFRPWRGRRIGPDEHADDLQSRLSIRFGWEWPPSEILPDGAMRRLPARLLKNAANRAVEG